MPQTPLAASGGAMLQDLATYAKDFTGAVEAGRGLALPEATRLENVVFAGMGGSGIGGSLVAALAAPTSPVPIAVVKDYQLPKFVGPKTLVVATSYSGNTEETLWAVAEARARGASVAAIASGGALADHQAKKGGPVYRVPAGRQPRAALPFLFGGACGIAHRLGLMQAVLEGSDLNQLQNLQVRLEPKIAGSENEALRMAETLRHATPAIYAETQFSAVATRWKAQLNENAKIMARAEILPEANHNDLVPWSAAPRHETDVLVLLRRRDEAPELATRFDFVERVAAGRKVPVLTARAQARSRLGQCVELLLLGDYASVYTAILRNVDPTPVDIIGDLKKQLEKTGRAQEARKRLGLG